MTVFIDTFYSGFIRNVISANIDELNTSMRMIVDDWYIDTDSYIGESLVSQALNIIQYGQLLMLAYKSASS